MTLKKNKFLIFLLCFISLSLIFAYVIQYVLGHQPCRLCIYERLPYIISVFLITIIIFFKKHEKILLLILLLIFIGSTILAFYHFGIEQGYFDELVSCKNNNISDDLSKEKILELLNENNVSCKEVSFKILGLSLATINTIFSFILSVIFTKLFINYEKN